MRILTPYAAAFAGYEQKETEMVDIVVQREAARTNSPPIGRGLSESHPVRPLIRFRSKTHDGMVKHRRPESKTEFRTLEWLKSSREGIFLRRMRVRTKCAIISLLMSK